MYSAIFITSVLVALDAMFIGMSLKLQKGFKNYFAFIMIGIMFLLSVIFFFIAGAVKNLINFDMRWIVGTVFLLVAIKNLFSKDEEKITIKIWSLVLIGLIMSIDAVVATSALTIDYGRNFLIPVIVSAFHLLFLFIGCFVARFFKNMPHKIHNIISASCLAIIAILNFARVF